MSITWHIAGAQNEVLISGCDSPQPNIEDLTQTVLIFLFYFRLCEIFVPAG